MKLRVLIIDDEALARAKLRRLLADEPDIEVVGECANGREAVDAINAGRADLVFLDVQMPELDGFGVLKEIKPGNWPLVVFVTAHDRFALQAFEVHALDYLLKPFDRDRFRAALARAREQFARRQNAELSQKLQALVRGLETARQTEARPGRIAVKYPGRVTMLNVDDIDWIEAADNYVKLHAGKQSHLTRETMSAMEARLAPDKFVRINRSTIVNTDRIKELQPLFHGEYAVILSDGTRLTLSRTHRDRLARILGTMP